MTLECGEEEVEVEDAARTKAAHHAMCPWCTTLMAATRVFQHLGTPRCEKTRMLRIRSVPLAKEQDLRDAVVALRRRVETQATKEFDELMTYAVLHAHGPPEKT